MGRPNPPLRRLVDLVPNIHAASLREIVRERLLSELCKALLAVLSDLSGVRRL